ncbi:MULTISPECIES: caspase domain-containing protein [Chryseobacterium]|uniref:caspase family protein n=1 Tax=Chryseobacterium TaxID=59732 RepID=UPI00195A1932|nr:MULTISPECIES: caspase family protein [Chryseobacterium]MBM7420168.1 hypothetical protein [Chryseobacterium sp. JUb44]MDH6210107.1 hypothetical protein [Chryseobacterium sp. BIGb0186]WSO08834.1 caspase family protein [Chryseobacterium scophthalmum]
MSKKALVIGINDYRHFTNLDKCINDATAIHDFVTSVGFESALLLNCTQADLIEALTLFKESLEDDTVSLIYFSGHGIQDDKHNYVILSDSNAKTDLDIRYNCIQVDEFLIEKKEKNLHFIILDACREDLHMKGKKGGSFGLMKMNSPAGTLIAFSTAPNTNSIERETDDNGIYTKHLLKNMLIPNLSIEKILKQTRNDVITDTDSRQIPWDESSLIGEDFYFIYEDNGMENTINKVFLSQKNPHIPTFLPMFEKEHISSLSLGSLQLALTLTNIGLAHEQQGLTKSTISVDYLIDQMVDVYLPKFDERLLDEDKSNNDFEINLLTQIKLEGSNYGFNELEPAEDAFPQIIANYISLEGKRGILSFFLTAIDGKHLAKPLIILEDGDNVEFINYKSLTGKVAETILNDFFKLREENEEPETNQMTSFKWDEPSEDFFKEMFEKHPEKRKKE